MTNGNATGLGLADVITRKLYDAIDYPSTYANVITSAYLDGALIPIAMPTDQQALQLAYQDVGARQAGSGTHRAHSRYTEYRQNLGFRTDAGRS